MWGLLFATFSTVLNQQKSIYISAKLLENFFLAVSSFSGNFETKQNGSKKENRLV
jgi:hypothetical protein